MVRSAVAYTIPAALLLLILPFALAHGDDEHGAAADSSNATVESNNHADHEAVSYFAAGGHTGILVAHVTVEVLAWMFILPVGTSLCEARSFPFSRKTALLIRANRVYANPNFFQYQV